MKAPRYSRRAEARRGGRQTATRSHDDDKVRLLKTVEECADRLQFHTIGRLAYAYGETYPDMFDSYLSQHRGGLRFMMQEIMRGTIARMKALKKRHAAPDSSTGPMVIVSAQA